MSSPALGGETALLRPVPVPTDWRATAAAVALHLMLFALLALATRTATRLLRPTEPGAISVELVAPPLVPAEPDASAALAAPMPVPDAEAVPPAAPSPSDAMVEATDLRARSVLAAPENRDIAEGFSLYADSERVVQLCNLEALEQIRAAQPESAADTLVAYAMDDMDVTGLVLDAPGGAFRSHDQWYEIALRCEVTPDLAGVASFAYRLGGPIPEEIWEEHFLTTVAQERDYEP